jgi:hypothetical protein
MEIPLTRQRSLPSRSNWFEMVPHPANSASGSGAKTTGRFKRRILGALRLDPAVYEDVERDGEALGQALTVVVLSSLATGVGASPFPSDGESVPLLVGVLFALIGWVAWAGLIFIIGTKLVPEPQTRSDVVELMRTTGFAAAPGLFGLLGLLPLVGSLVTFGVSLWMLMAMVVAVRQALDFTSVWRSFGVVVTGWLAYLLLLLLI